MLASFRALAGTWPARIFFFLLAASFVVWGVASRSSLGGLSGNAIASVRGQEISATAFQEAFQRELAQAQRMFPDPSQMPPALRQQAAQQALGTLVTQKALEIEAHRLGLAAPDAAVREAVFTQPAFQGPNGFDRATFLQILAANRLTEARFLDLTRAELLQKQLLGAIAAGAAPPPVLVDQVWRFLHETRDADAVTLPFAGQTPAKPATDADLHRFYDNNKKRFATQELRHIKLVVLSPDTIARSLPLTDADLHAWFDRHRDEFVKPEKRSLQVITAADAHVADTLAAQWKAGADWKTMQAAAATAGASTVELTDSTAVALPSPDLARAAFAARQGEVTGPITEPLGRQIFRVTAITPAENPSFDSLKDLIRVRLGLERAADLIDARSQKLQDILAGGATLDEIPADLGAAAATGTLDAQGRTAAGEPAPLPARGALRDQIVAEAFREGVNETPRLIDGPDQSWFALQVQSITPATTPPFDQVRAEVQRAWTEDEIRHQQETTASRLLGLVKGGQSLTQAAWGTGQKVSHMAAIPRQGARAGVPAELQQRLFTLKKGEATMVETKDGFTVAVLTGITTPDPKSDPTGLATLRDRLRGSMAQGAMQSYADALRNAGNPQINGKMLQAAIGQ